MNDIQYRQPQNSRIDEQLAGHSSMHVPSKMTDDVTTATLASIEETNNLAPTPAEATYPFLDALGSRLDEFTTADEGFRAYLEAQLGQYEFNVF
jgi:hypothetical protein